MTVSYTHLDVYKRQGSSIFEDSIEASFSSSAWSYNLIDEMEQDGYQYTTELPLVKALGASSFDDSAITAEIGQDYNLLMGRMYEQKHAADVYKRQVESPAAKAEPPAKALAPIARERSSAKMRLGWCLLIMLLSSFSDGSCHMFPVYSV